MRCQKQCMGCMEFYEAAMDVCPYCGYVDGTEWSHVLHITPGTLLHQRYVIGKALGYGSFGVTYIAWDRVMKRKVAIKEYLPSEYATRALKGPELVIPESESNLPKFERGMSKFHQEAEKLAKVGNIDGVVYVYDTFKENKTAYIVMEYLQGETLTTYLKQKGILSEAEILDLMLPVLQALEAVHEKDIIHRDISPDNLFVCIDSAGNRNVKLIDFGAARFATSSHSKSLTVLLRSGYSPEEQYRSSGDQGPHTDVYAIAAVMYQMATGVRPPDSLERRTAIERKKRDLLKAPSAYNPELSDNFETTLLNALNVRIEDRTPTADALLAELISFEKVKRRGSSIKRIDFLRWPLWAKIGVPAAGVAAIAVLVGVSLWLAGLVSPDETFTMPENYTFVSYFVGATLEDAEKQAENAVLVISRSAAEYSPNMDAGLILRQDIPAGSIMEKNTIVNLTISSGIETYSLPDVTGLSLSEARYALECMGLEVLTEEGYQEGLAANCVISQSIAPYSDINYGETITLTVTPDGEPESGTAPDLIGMTYTKALAAADAAGVQLVVSEKVFSREHADTEVLEQSMDPGDEINAEDCIEITIALQWREFVMPNLMYKNRDVAVQLLRNIGISADISEEVSEVVSKGLVCQQSVEKNTTVQPGDAVQLTVSKGSTPFAMPSVVGLSETDARTTLTEAKLSVAVEYGFDENVAEGNVISQSIANGEEVTRGTSVTIIVCSADGLVAVENVVGLTSEKASEKLYAQGLEVQINEVYSPTIDNGLVMEQLPAAGSMQKEGSAIILIVSKGADPATISEKTTPDNDDGDELEQRSWKWSDWSTEVPAATREYETKTQYRYRTRETTTSEKSSMAGWSLYDTQSAWSDYGKWSDWSTTVVSADDSTKVESKIQYRYCDKETTMSTNSSLDGWTQTVSSQSWGDYGSWSNWQDSSVSSSDSRKVETRTVYGYYYFLCSNCGAHMHYSTECFSWAGGCGSTTSNMSWHEVWSTTSWDNAGLSEWHGTGKYYTYINGELVFKWPESNSPKTQYRYCDRSKITTYTYERWGTWSDWSDSPYYESDTRKVERRLVYRSCTRTESTTYYYERWSDWSQYSDTKVSNGDNTEVQTRILYRYKIYD